MRIFAAALLLPLCAAAQADWRFAHPDATLVGAIRPTQLLDSPLLASAWTGAAPDNPQAAGMMAMAKGLLSGIQEIRFSIMENGTSEPDVVAVIEGRFDEAMLGMIGQGKGNFRRIDDHTLLLGNGPSLEKAVARLTDKAPVLQPRALAGVEVLAAYDLWISGRLPNLPNGAFGLPAVPKFDVRGLALGLSMRDNVEIELAVDTSSPVAADKLLKAAHAEEATQPAQFRGLLRTFADGNTAHFRLNVPRELAMEAMRTRNAPALAASNSLQPMPAPRRSTIRIQGLDDGPREIELK